MSEGDGGAMARRGFGTLSVHGPSRPRAPGEPHAPPLFQTSAFAYPESERAVAAFSGGEGYVYTRSGNPTIRALERHVAVLEAHPVDGEPEPGGAAAGPADPGPGGASRGDGEETDARFFASGMAAIGAVAMGVAGGGRLVCQEGIYGTTVIQARLLERYGVVVDFARAGDVDALRATVGEGEPPALVHIETPANPLLQVTDIAAAAGIAHDAGALLAVDATFATPALQRPLRWGADFSLHSTTKFVGGHGVALGGVVSARRELLERHVDPIRKNLGGVADPFAAWLTLMGLRTLDVRMARHGSSAAALAGFLARHPGVRTLHRADPSRLPAGQLAGPGPMLSFEVEGGSEAALALIDRLALATLAPTLGTLDTLVQHPYSMSHGVLPEARRRALGIGPGLVRVSVGLEDPEDLVADFASALEP